MEGIVEGLLRELWIYRSLPYYTEDKEKRYLEYKMKHNDLSWEDTITFVNIGLDHEYYTEIQQISLPYEETVLVNKYHQLPRNFIPGDLEVINSCYNISTLMLRHNARIAFELMCQAAELDGLRLQAISSFRSFTYQNQVYYKNWIDDIPLDLYQAERDKVSARAGHSEHQTGLAVDINDLEQSFEETTEGKWLAEYSHHYGFILRYPKGKEKITGYDYEPWHFRYLGHELSDIVFHSKLTYDEFFIRNINAADGQAGRC